MKTPPPPNPLIENDYFYLSSDGTYYIVGNEYSCSGASTEFEINGHLDIPAEYNGKPVKEIGHYAFYGCSSLSSVTIPNSVTSIGSEAFSDCSSLTSITVDPANTVYKSDGNCIIEKATNNLIVGCKNSIIPNYVTSIGNYAFYDTALISVTIPDSVISIEDYAFAGCVGTSLTSVTIGNGVTSIGRRAFYNCTALTSVTIGNGVTSIGSAAFYNCSSLTSITIPNSVTSIGNSAFNSCTSLISINIPDSVTSIGNYAFQNCSALISINIPDSVTSIENNAFSDCIALTSITIPNSVTSIEYYAFGYCFDLKTVIIKGKPTVNSSAFKDTTKLEKIYVIEGKGYTSSDTIGGKPIEILPAEPSVIAKTMTVKSMTIS